MLKRALRPSGCEWCSDQVKGSEGAEGVSEGSRRSLVKWDLLMDR